MTEYFGSKFRKSFNFWLNTKIPIIDSRLGYIIAGIIFLLLGIIALRDFLLGNSFYIYRDVIWPTSNVDLLYEYFFSLDLEATRRLIFLGPFFLIIKLLGISSLATEKLLFLLIRFMIGFFAYVAVYNFISSKIGNYNKNKNIIFLVSILSGFFYLYNPTATTMVSATVFFAFTYSLLPLLFYFYDKALNETRFYNIFMASTLISLAISGVTQFLIFIPLFILIPWLVITCFKRGKEKVLSTIKNSFSIFLLWILMSFYYILVTLSIYSEGVKLHPSYVLTYDFLSRLSRDTTFINIIRLLGDWWPRINLDPIINDTLWNALTFIVPITTIAFIVFSWRTKLRFYLFSFFLITLLIIFVHKGSQPPLSEFYHFLYDLPVVGWMFHIPSKFAMLLSFFVMMILSLGFYNMLISKTSPIKRILKYVFVGSFIISISIISWPMFAGDLGGTYKPGEYPEEPFLGSRNEPNFISVTGQDLGILGGLDKLESFNAFEFDQKNSSLIFFDQDFNNNLYNMTAIDKLIFDNKQDAIMHVLPESSIILGEPFEVAKRDDPKDVWSIARTSDPNQGEFHTELDKFSLKNYDIDYGKGLVLTWGEDKIQIPIKVSKADKYTLYIRYMQNNYGGPMNISIDNHSTMINSQEQHSKFVWKEIENLDLTSGEHILSLENLSGLNVVNIIVLVPSYQISYVINQVHNLAEKGRNIHIFEAESANRSNFRQQNLSYLNQITEDPRIYGIQKGVSMGPGSHVETNFELLKDSKYTIATRVKTCETCTSLTIRVGDISKVFDLRNNITIFKWLYFTTGLNANKTNLIIYSEGDTELDKVVVYSDSYEKESIEKLFGEKMYNATVRNYSKITPTRYHAEVNANSPFILEFKEPYNPLWRAYVNGVEYKPIEIYYQNASEPSTQIVSTNFPAINGFIINQKGILNIIIEYSPLKWFPLGILVTILTYAGSLGYLFWKRRRTFHAYSKLS